MIGAGFLVVPDVPAVAVADRMLAVLGLKVEFPVGPVLLQMLEHAGKQDRIAQAVREVDQDSWHGILD